MALNDDKPGRRLLRQRLLERQLAYEELRALVQPAAPARQPRLLFVIALFSSLSGLIGLLIGWLVI